MNPHLQPGIHPDADQLSVFVEGAATAREQEKMLAHLAECGECRKAVFLMQAQEETQRAAPAAERRWIWRRLVPVGLPAAALACGLIALLIYLRPHGAPATSQQMASARQPEAERPGTAVTPTTNAESERGAPSANANQKANSNSEGISRFEGRPNGISGKVAGSIPGGQSRIASDVKLPANGSGPTFAGATPQIGLGSPITSVQTADATLAQNTVTSKTVSNLPLNGRNLVDLQQLQTADTNDAALQDSSAKKKELPALQIQATGAQNETLAGISGSITDRTGAVIAGATVTLRDAAGKTRQSTSGTDGSFHLMQLPAGQYELTASASGFRTSQQSIELKPSELAMLQPVLDVGAASEVVEVEAGNSAVAIQTESANVGGQAVAEITGVHRGITLPSGLEIAGTVSHGKRFLSLDDAGNLFLSRNGGKKWKKVKPQWAGKGIRIELASESVREATHQPKDEPAGEAAVFLLTTDGGTIWSSKDGAHWHQQ